MAKLVEILAGKLSEWPEEAVAIAQDHDECAHPYDSASLEFNHGEWGGEEAEVQISSFNVRMPERASDYSTAIVTRAEWQAAVDALKPDAQRFAEDYVEANKDRHAKEWNGEGLPPVGTTCEFRSGLDKKQAWYWRTRLEDGMRVTIIAHYSPCNDDDLVAVFAFGDDKRGRETDQAIASCFKVIRTPEQIAAEEREQSLQEMEGVANEGPYGPMLSLRNVMMNLYDAGYRKQEPK